MNSSNASVDGLLQWLAHSQQPLPPPGSVTLEALLAGNFAAPRQHQPPSMNHDSSSFLQMFQQGSEQNGATNANPHRFTNVLGSSFAPLTQGPNERRRTSLIDMSGMRAPVAPSPMSRAAPVPLQKKGMNQRQEFFVLVKLLLKVLKDNQDTDRLVRAKSIIAECTHRNRNGDTAFANLQVSVELRLRRTVGEVYWSQAKDKVDRVRRRQGMIARARQAQGVVAAV